MRLLDTKGHTWLLRPVCVCTQAPQGVACSILRLSILRGSSSGFVLMKPSPGLDAAK